MPPHRIVVRIECDGECEALTAVPHFDQYWYFL